nr:MAG TPA: hypothetical protein [Caudoviricetes sp.]
MGGFYRKIKSAPSAQAGSLSTKAVAFQVRTSYQKMG